MWKGTGRLEKKKPVHIPMYPTFSSSPLWLDSRLRCDKCIPLYLKEKKKFILILLRASRTESHASKQPSGP